MTYVMGDSIETKIYNGELATAILMLLERVKALEPKCNHESDETMHTLHDLAGKLPIKELGVKCIKCGEFYR